MTKTSMKRITKVTIRIMTDNDPDTSYLGEFSSKKTSAFSLDRKHAIDCQINDQHNQPVIDQLERAIDYLNIERNALANDIQEDSGLWDEAQDELISLQDELAECDCGDAGDMGRNEHQYFNPSFNYVQKDGSLQPPNTADEVRQYVRQDYQRLSRLYAGDWCYIGIRASADVQLTADGPSQTIESGGLWGIESDSDRNHLEEVKTEELSQLKTELHALGFSKRAIASAFKNQEEVSQ